MSQSIEIDSLRVVFGSITNAFIQPDGVHRERTGDVEVVRTPSRPDYWGGNLLVLPEPLSPGGIGALVRTWSERFGKTPGIERLMIEWEAEPSWRSELLRPTLPPGFELEASLVLSLDGEPVRTTSRDEQPTAATEDRHWEGIAALARDEAHDSPELWPFLDWQVQALRRRVEQVDGDFWVVEVDGRVVASTGLLRTQKFARFVDMRTLREHRRQGHCSNLCYRLAAAHHRRAPDVALVVVAEPDSTALRIYERTGFVHRTTLWTLGADLDRVRSLGDPSRRVTNEPPSTP